MLVQISIPGVIQVRAQPLKQHFRFREQAVSPVHVSEQDLNIARDGYGQLPGFTTAIQNIFNSV